jgi:acetylornithine deacetylase/succinyl-diaminopimelate desuccinylase-like protein
LESAVKEIRELPGVRSSGAEIEVLEYAVPSWRGLVYPTKKYYPTWLLPGDHPALGAGVEAFEKLFGRKPEIGRWVFSTNGVAIMGLHKIPCIGFGPGNEVYAHMATEQIPVAHLVHAMAWYAAFPTLWLQHRK